MMVMLCNEKNTTIRAMRPMVFCQIRLSTGQIHKVDTQYQEIVKTTRY